MGLYISLSPQNCVYDDFGNLRFVIPPIVNANSFTLNDMQFNQYIYGYQYDGRNRLIRKKIPGKGWEEMVYNRLDQVVLSQDSLQRTSAKRRFTKYDALGRMVISRIVTDQSLSRKNVQDTVNAKLILWETKDTTATNFHGYSNLSYPSQVTTLEPEVIQYYDNYNLPGIPFDHQSTYSNKTKGLPTATKVKVLGTNDFLWTVNYYDDKARVVKTYSQHYLEGSAQALNYDEVSNHWSFTGELDTMIRVHHSTAGTTTIFNRYEYDHMGRKLTTWQSFNDQPQVLLSSNSYNEIGQLKQKQLHNQLQSTTYTYNERGWLKSSNSDEFSQQLQYEDGALPQFNGNISGQVWNRDTVINNTNTFTYNYDKLNRLLSGISTGVSMNEALTYDVMGNIDSLTRNGQSGNYNYNGHQLSQISGNLLTTGVYAYDGNGNAITDGRNGVSLTYNSLNLPATVSKAGLSMAYTYDATGNKLKKINGNSTRDYIQGIEYQDNSIELIHTEEGFAQRNGSIYTYHYNLKDHLGNVRLTFDVHQGAIRPLQTNDYYPFGLSKNPLDGSNNNKYLYNGKELQEELGIYDYHARQYDPVIGRFTSVDPLAELYYSTNPYSYVENNPMIFTDPTGMGKNSTHTDASGNVLAVYDDDDLGVYKHDDAKSKADIDKKYSKNNTSADGTKMGETWTPLSFADFDAYEESGVIKVKNGTKIDFGSNWATDQVNSILGGDPSAKEYAGKAGFEGPWDIKSNAKKEGGTYYSGSKLFGKYASARDAGNFAAGAVAQKSNWPNLLIDYGFGLYNQSNNSKPVAALMGAIDFAIGIANKPAGIGLLLYRAHFGENPLSKAGIEAGKAYIRGK